MLKLSAILGSCSLALTTIASATTPLPTPQPVAKAPVITPQPPHMNVKAYVLMDAATGHVVASDNPHRRLPPASLTKLMTIYIAANALHNQTISLNDPVRISKKAWSMTGSRMFLNVGSQVPVKELLQGIIVDSGNDACVAMAQFIAGNEKTFAGLMNQSAAYLGMKDTHYVDSTGLPRADHYATAYDITLLAKAIINQFPEYYPWFKQKWFTYNKIKQSNRNRLLWRDPSVDGLKTGHTKAAGYCLAASGNRDNTRLIAVVMGAPTDEGRANDAQALLNYGFRFYKTQHLHQAGDTISQQRVWLGSNSYVPVGVTQNFSVTVPKRSGNQKLTTTITWQNPHLSAPIAKGQTLGTIEVKSGQTLLNSAPLVALKADPRGGLWTRFTDHIAMAWDKWL